MSLEEDLTVLIDYEKYQKPLHPQRSTSNQSVPLDLKDDTGHDQCVGGMCLRVVSIFSQFLLNYY